MNKLTQNIIHTFGKKGQAWLADLPHLINSLAAHWQLTNIQPVDNMSFNFVAKATSKIHGAIVLKISCDEKSIQAEKHALTYFAGSASIKLLDYHAGYHALLLHQAIPGRTLKSLYPQKLEYVMDCYVSTLKRLHQNNQRDTSNFDSTHDWLKAIDHADPQKIPGHLLTKAIDLKNQLLNSAQQKILLHGDLHHDNILQEGNDWIAIDPKGVIGEPEFEIAAFDFMYVNELANKQDAKKIFASRIKLLAEKSQLDANRIHDWIFVRLILMAAWSIEDGDDASSAIQLAELM